MRPGLLVLVVSMHDESLYADRVLRAGARGYISKHEGGDRLMQAVRQVLSGKIYVSETVSARILEMLTGKPRILERSLMERLSDREFEVFERIGEGLSTRQNAKSLRLSAKTVDAHRASLKEKLGIKTMPELIAYAARWLGSRPSIKPVGTQEGREIT